jgi:hypothetical protein
MTTPLTFGAYGFADATPGALTGEAGLGFYRLQLQVKLQIHGIDGDPGRAAELRDLRVDVSMAAPNQQRLGRLTPEPRFLPLRNYDRASSFEGSLAMDLDVARLEALEAVRNGGDLMLELSWHSAIADSNGTVHHSTHDEVFEVLQSNWIRVINRLGYAKLMLLEVPLLDGLGPTFSEAVGHLRNARSAMLRGEYREAVGGCRDVIEALTRALGDKDEQLAKLVGNTRDLDKADRQRLLRQALKVLTHPARHADEVAASFEWTRIDAITIIAMTASVMQMLTAPGARTIVAALA